MFTLFETWTTVVSKIEIVNVSMYKKCKQERHWHVKYNNKKECRY